LPGWIVGARDRRRKNSSDEGVIATKLFSRITLSIGTVGSGRSVRNSIDSCTEGSGEGIGFASLGAIAGDRACDFCFCPRRVFLLFGWADREYGCKYSVVVANVGLRSVPPFVGPLAGRATAKNGFLYSPNGARTRLRADQITFQGGKWAFIVAGGCGILTGRRYTVF
jgi:hypothetical protein